VDPDLWSPCGERFAQGDIILAPVGLFTAADFIEQPGLVDEAGEVLTLKDVQGLARTVPRLAIKGVPVVLRAWFMPAIVLSPDCSFDKDDAESMVIAGIWPIDAYAEGDRDGVRAGTSLNGFHLPQDKAVRFRDGSSKDWPEAVVDLASETSVNPSLVFDQRMIALSDSRLDLLQEALLRHYAGREISTTGTLEAVKGRTLIEVETLETSKRRHTVLLTFDEGTPVVLYQEPRKKAEALQSLRIKEGLFHRAAVAAKSGTNALLRIENEDARDWHLSCEELNLKAHLIARAATTTVLLRDLPPGIFKFVNADKRQQTFDLEVAESSA
jgi:hypothetical protein